MITKFFRAIFLSEFFRAILEENRHKTADGNFCYQRYFSYWSKIVHLVHFSAD